ncbi:helix-turn-helix domain-containing protein [Thermotoga sp.]|uniref:helix-turn-helix transcriptional regulator n=1 Tax=Thermotoga sp. TaxID=28240 RepID=UPI0025DE0B15|nr:helix-turn-helix domain-containing protein [Thermotoga sp.]MCD6551374.1 helix-turn-helix domain-containing protein [Thermotoga sp.]
MKEFLTRKDIMELFNISRSTVIRMEKRGELKPIRISPRKIVYRREDIEELLQSKMKGAKE